MTWTDLIGPPPAKWTTRVALDGARGPDLIRMLDATPIPQGDVEAITAVELMRASGFEPYDFQLELLGVGVTNPLRAGDVTRQAGKTTIQGAGGLETVSAFRRVDVGVLTPTMEQSMKVLADVRQFYLDTHDLFGLRMPRLLNWKSEAPRKMFFSNGSRIIAMSAASGSKATGAGSTNRGSRLKRLIVDEAAFVPFKAVAALFPALAARNGDMIATSTMWAAYGWWWEVINGIGERKDLFHVVRRTVDDIPHITQEHKRQARALMGEAEYLREYYSIPPESGSLIPRAAIEAMTPATAPVVTEEWKPSWS